MDADFFPEANRNWTCFQRWLDISNHERGVTWCSLDAPTFEHGDIRAADFPAEEFRRRLEEQGRLRPYSVGDFYPLTGYSFGADAWMAFQFDRPDLGEGAVLAFRRDQSPYSSATVRLRGLAPDAQYRLEFADTGEERVASGAELSAGLTLTIGKERESLLIWYERIGGTS